jgi:hypothetical protein
MNQLTNILNLAVQITDKTEYDVHFNYAAHVSRVTISINIKNDESYVNLFNKCVKLSNTQKMTELETDLTTFLNENTK